MRNEHRQAADRDAPVPEGDAIEAAERGFDKREQRRKHERATEQEHGLDAAELTDEAPARFTGGSCEHPKRDRSKRENNEHRWTDVAARGTLF